MENQHHIGLKILSVVMTCDRLNCSRSWLYEQLNQRSPHFNETLPKPVRNGTRVGFVEHEIDAYIRGLMAARGGDTFE